MVKRVFGIGSAIVVLAVLVACATAPVTGRRQLNLVSAGEEVQLGITEFEKMKHEVPISKDPAANALVQKVGKRVAAAVGTDLPNAQWEFVVFDSDEANAFCLPGGKVGVYRGILPITQTEAGLATVIGHEVAHATAHHGAERMSHAMAAQTGGQLLGVALSSTDPMVQSLVSMAYPALAQVGVLLPYSRKQESEADHIGMIYMARAGYDPAEAVKFWERFQSYNQQNSKGSSVPAFLRTHPVDSLRIKQLKEWLPEAEGVFRSSGMTSSLR